MLLNIFFTSRTLTLVTLNYIYQLWHMHLSLCNWSSFLEFIPSVL